MPHALPDAPPTAGPSPGPGAAPAREGPYRGPHAGLVGDLTPEQREAVLHDGGPLLILAGAGSGKTRVVTRRIARLVRDGADPASIVAITFTNKAAGEMRERVHALLGGGGGPGREPVVSTFHAYAVRLLREHAARLGLPRAFAILDEDDRLALVREAAVQARVDVERFRAPALAHAIGRAKERLDDAAFAREARTPLERAAAEVLPGYRALARARGGLDFEDLVAMSVGLLEDHADVRAALHDRVRHVLVDEYQDTNHAQYRLAGLLAGPRRQLTVCGDPDQSIYGWRGADMGNILRFEEDYPGARVVLLERNYRSTATILRAANHLIGHNAVRKDKQLRPAGAEGGPIEVKRCLDEEFEAEWVARRVEEVIAQGTPPAEVAVVFRAGAHARRYEDALLRRSVPCAQAGAVSFADRREVKDALAWVRLALHPADDLAALRAIKGRVRGLGPKTLDKLHQLQRERGCSIVEACARAPELAGLTRPTQAALAGFAGLVRELEGVARGPAEGLVRAVAARAGLHADLAAEPERQKSLETLAQSARDADRRAGKAGRAAGARELLDRLALLDGQDGRDGKEAVTLTTVHAAKGLEWDVVFVVGLEEGLFPHQRALDEGGLEEERRLAYVAFTRARQRLVLSYAGLRATRSPAQERRRPSTFLYELPLELLWEPDRKAPPDLPERGPEPEGEGAPGRRGGRAGRGGAPPLAPGGLLGRTTGAVVTRRARAGAATAAPGAVAAPTPATSEPTPATSEPTPAASRPTPAASRPTPAASRPTPAASRPTPAASRPTPAARSPAPASGLWSRGLSKRPAGAS